MTHTLDLVVLRTFVTVSDLKSMSAASQALHVTQGAISQQIARLEQLVGEPVLLRTARGLRLTPSGERLLARARAMLAMNDEALAEIRGGVIAGPVRLGLPYDLVGTSLAPAVKSYCEALPQVELSLVCLPSPDLLAAVRDGQLDVAVVEELLGSESGEILAVDRLVWVGARGGLAHSRTPLPLSLVAPGCVFRRPILAALARQGRESRTVFENGGLDATRAIVGMDLRSRPSWPPKFPRTSPSCRRKRGCRSCLCSRSQCTSGSPREAQPSPRSCAICGRRCSGRSRPPESEKPRRPRDLRRLGSL